jgi:hypothetical protein
MKKGIYNFKHLSLQTVDKYGFNMIQDVESKFQKTYEEKVRTAKIYASIVCYNHLADKYSNYELFEGQVKLYDTPVKCRETGNIVIRQLPRNLNRIIHEGEAVGFEVDNDYIKFDTEDYTVITTVTDLVEFDNWERIEFSISVEIMDKNIWEKFKNLERYIDHKNKT